MTIDPRLERERQRFNPIAALFARARTAEADVARLEVVLTDQARQIQELQASEANLLRLVWPGKDEPPAGEPGVLEYQPVNEE